MEITEYLKYKNKTLTNVYTYLHYKTNEKKFMIVPIQVIYFILWMIFIIKDYFVLSIFLLML